MRLVFLGQPCAASLPPLAALLEAGYEVGSVILAGKPQSPPGDLEATAEACDVPVVWVVSAAEAAISLAAATPRVAAAVCFPWRLPASVLDAPPLGILNVHPSLLPAGRGAEPVFWTLRRGERATGVTVHRMDAGLDTGPIVAQAELPVAAGTRAPELELELMRRGGELLVEALPALDAGALQPRPQPGAGESRSPVPSPADWTVPSSLPAAWAWSFARGVAPLRGPLTVVTPDTAIPVLDALDWSPDERLGDRVVHDGEGTVRVRFSPGWVRFQPS